MAERCERRRDDAQLAERAPAQVVPPSATLPLILGVVGPFGRTISLPGALPHDSFERRIDELAADIAAEAAAREPLASARAAIETRAITHLQWPYAWSTPEDGLIRLLGEEHPLALVGCIEPGQHVWSALSAVAGIPWVNAALTAPDAAELDSPWIFRCPRNDPREQARFFDRAFDSLHSARPVLLRSGEAFADLHLEWWKQRAAARGTPVIAELLFPSSEDEFARCASALRELSFDALLTWSDAGSTADFVRRLRERGFEAPVLGSDDIVTESFLRRAGPAPGRVLALQPCAHRLDEAGRALLLERTVGARADAPSRGPSPLTWASYDAARHAIEALAEAGGDRERLCRTLIRSARARLVHISGAGWQALD